LMCFMGPRHDCHWIGDIFHYPALTGTTGESYAVESLLTADKGFSRRWMAKRFIEREASEHWYREQIRVAELNEEERMKYDQEQEQLQAVRDEVAAHFGGVK